MAAFSNANSSMYYYYGYELYVVSGQAFFSGSSTPVHCYTLYAHVSCINGL